MHKWVGTDFADAVSDVSMDLVFMKWLSIFAGCLAALAGPAFAGQPDVAAAQHDVISVSGRPAMWLDLEPLLPEFHHAVVADPIDSVVFDASSGNGPHFTMVPLPSSGIGVLVTVAAIATLKVARRLRR
jgi:hypothetical protein